MPPTVQRDIHMSALVGVFAGIVDERADEPLQARAVGVHDDSLGYVRVKVDMTFECDRFELQGVGRHDLAQVDVAIELGVLVGIGFRQEQQVGDERLHHLGLRLRALDPLSMLADGLVGM